MTVLLRSKVVKIGNSRGIRIPRLLLEQAGLSDEIEMSVEGDKLIIHSARAARFGWEAQFANMHVNSDDRLLDNSTSTQWDKAEWEW